MSVTEKAVEFAIKIANDNSHGYSQQNRNGNPDYDCSSLVIACYRNAGLKLNGASWTGNMYHSFLAEGFVDVKDRVDRYTGEGLQRGDVLLNTSNHTCIAIGGGKVVNARTDTDGISGDSHGDEIRIQPYWDYNPWNYILRYMGDEPNVEKPKEEVLIPNGTKGIGIAMLQGGLKYLGYNLGWYGIDGDAGLQHSYTNIATRQAIDKKEISKETLDYLLSLSQKGG